MNRTLRVFGASTSCVLAITLAVGGLVGGSGVANADNKRKPTPTPTPTTVPNGPGCAEGNGGAVYWHRDNADTDPATQTKLNSGSLTALVFLNSSSCPDYTYRYTLFSDVDPSRWPDPDALLASLEELRQAHALSKR